MRVALVCVLVVGLVAVSLWWFVLRSDADKIRAVLSDVEEAIEENDSGGVLDAMTLDVRVHGVGSGAMRVRPWLRSSLGTYRDVDVRVREFALDVGGSESGAKTANVELEVQAWGEHVLNRGTRVAIHEEAPFRGRDTMMLRFVEVDGDWKIAQIHLDP